MKSWLVSREAAIAVSLIALLAFLGRGFMDWRYEYPFQDPAGDWDIPGALAYMALAGGWIWGLLSAQLGSRRGLVALLVFALLLDVALGLATYFIFCPPWTGCEGWPNAWFWNWLNLITGLLAALAVGRRLIKAESAG